MRRKVKIVTFVPGLFSYFCSLSFHGFIAHVQGKNVMNKVAPLDISMPVRKIPSKECEGMPSI